MRRNSPRGYHSKSYGEMLFAMAHMHVNLHEMVGVMGVPVYKPTGLNTPAPSSATTS